MLVDDGLGVVALRVASRRLDVARVEVGRVDLPGRRVGRLVGVRTGAEAPAVARHRSRAMLLIGLVGLALDRQVLRQPPLSLEQPRRPRARNWVGLDATMLLELMLRFALPAPAALDASDDHLRIKLELDDRRF